MARFCTVSTTIMIVDKYGQVYFEEQRYRHE